MALSIDYGTVLDQKIDVHALCQNIRRCLDPSIVTVTFMELHLYGADETDEEAGSFIKMVYKTLLPLAAFSELKLHKPPGRPEPTPPSRNSLDSNADE